MKDSEAKLYKVSIDFLIRDHECNYTIYIQLRDRKIKYRTGDSNNEETLVQLKAKGVDFVYLDDQSYKDYINKRKNEHSQLIDKDLQKKKDILVELNKDERNLVLLLNEVGFAEQKIQAINAMKEKSYQILEKTSGFEEIVSLAKQIKPTPMIKKNLEIFIGTAMLKKTKLNDKKFLDCFISAILIFDSFLEEDEYWQSYSKNPKSVKVLNHSLDIIKKIPPNYFPSYMIPMIKEHHEKPDGSGYPNKITCTEMNIFTSIYIVAEEFVQEFIRRGMRTNEIKDVIEYINKIFSPYVGTNIEKALLLFNEAMVGGLNDN